MIDLFGCHTGPTNGLIDIAGLRVGHAICADGRGDSGTTVIVAPKGAIASVDVRGGGPGTRETDLLEPHNTVQQVHAISLSGGSAFGLDAASGVMAELESRGIGFPVLGPDHPDKVVPIVASAVIFDLLLGDWHSRPDAATGRAATINALEGGARGGATHAGKPSAEGDLGAHWGTGAGGELSAAQASLAGGELSAMGNVGAGLGASAGALKGGFGQASAVFPDNGPLAGVTVAAGVVVNPQGAVFNPVDGTLWGIAAELDEEFRHYGVGPNTSISAPAVERLRGMNRLGTKMLNTTIGVVATDLDLSKSSVKRMALAAHDGLARAIRPSHMPMDGDTLFGLSTGTKQLDDNVELPVAMTMIAATAASCVERAIVHAVLAAETAFDVPSWKEATDL
ncbi:P1 family peptidase [Corynebacterium sp. HMSC28B08]|uniref:P1 family peptidase n=1 Tax=Corynebacterium sp. HMSC28B08 TaxID=1581066 RepID=UPI0008A57EF2|nr:P1 family peptidase [Corynebacterium sp. HMSC28B08]OFT87327.1 aminopeptidase [Corynebacterium sp. HMSC28B08]